MLCHSIFLKGCIPSQINSLEHTNLPSPVGQGYSLNLGNSREVRFYVYSPEGDLFHYGSLKHHTVHSV